MGACKVDTLKTARRHAGPAFLFDRPVHISPYAAARVFRVKMSGTAIIRMLITVSEFISETVLLFRPVIPAYYAAYDSGLPFPCHVSTLRPGTNVPLPLGSGGPAVSADTFHLHE